MNKKPNVNKIIRQIFSHPVDFIFFIVFSVLMTGCAIASVVIIGSLVNAFYDNPNVRISMYVAPLVLLVVGFGGFYILMARFKSNITANITKELKEEAYLALLQAEMSEFDKDNYEKEVEQFVKNVEEVSEVYIGKNILSFFTIIILLVGFFLASLFIQPIFSLIVLLMISLYATADKTASLITNRTKERYEEELKKNSDVTFDTIKNLKNIKLLSGLDLEVDRYQNYNYNLSQASHARNVSRVITKYVLPFLFIGIIYAIILGVGGLMRADGNNISISVFVDFAIIIPIIIMSTYHAFHYQIKQSYVENEVAAIEKIIGLRSEIRSEPINSLDDIHTIKFENIGMDDTNVLSNVSFEIKQGEKIGIYSASKETRDTIFDLITKINKPDEGVISFNNCELNKINAKYLRTLIASIYDESHVFNDTIENNICYGYPFDEYKYNDALYRSGLKQLVSTLDEKDQKVLSADEDNEFNTRVIYAHAIYQDCKIYLINEDMANVSAALETELINEIYKLKNKTVIIETNKPYLLNKCDKIMVIVDGKVVEFGLYKELLSNKQSYYYRLIKGSSSRKSKAS